MLPTGPCSRGLLDLLAAVRNPDSSRRARGRIAFRLSVIHVDEGAALGATPVVADAAAAAVRSSVEASSYAEVVMHVAPLEDVFCCTAEHRQAAAEGRCDGREERRRKLVSLLEVTLSKAVTHEMGI